MSYYLENKGRAHHHDIQGLSQSGQDLILNFHSFSHSSPSTWLPSCPFLELLPQAFPFVVALWERSPYVWPPMLSERWLFMFPSSVQCPCPETSSQTPPSECFLCHCPPLWFFCPEMVFCKDLVTSTTVTLVSSCLSWAVTTVISYNTPGGLQQQNSIFLQFWRQ